MIEYQPASGGIIHYTNICQVHEAQLRQQGKGITREEGRGEVNL